MQQQPYFVGSVTHSASKNRPKSNHPRLTPSKMSFDIEERSKGTGSLLEEFAQSKVEEERQ